MLSTKEVMSGGVSGKNALTIAGGAMFVLSACGITKIDRGEVGRVARYGRTERVRGPRKGKPYRKKILQPGWHMVMPGVGSVEKTTVANTNSRIDTVIESEDGKQRDFACKVDWRVDNNRIALDIALFKFASIDEYKESVVGKFASALQMELHGQPETVIRDSSAVQEILFNDSDYRQKFYEKHGVIVDGLEVQNANQTAEQVKANAIVAAAEVNATALVRAAEINAEATIVAAERIATALGGVGIVGATEPPGEFGRFFDMPNQPSAS